MRRAGCSSWSRSASRSREEAAAAEALMRRELIVVGREGRRVELHLAHPLYGEAVRARMSVTRTATLQRRLADALESTEMHRSADLLRYAIWRLDSGGTAPVDVLLQAALLAQGALDSVLAERLARAAVDAGGGVLAERAVARALLGQERFAEAEAILLPLAAAARTDEERTWVALTRAHNLVIGLGRGDEAEAALMSAQQAISDRSLWRELELVRCWVLSQTGRPAEAAAASTALLEEPDDADREFCLRTAGIGAFAL